MRIARVLLAAGLSLAASLAVVPAAQAHADLVSSDPAGGATLATAPTELRLTFSEAADPTLSAIELLTSGAAPIPTGDTSVEQRTILVIPIDDPLPEGVYTVTWRVVSVDDGHVTAGAFAFGVGVGPSNAPAVSAAGTTTSGPTPLMVASKAALYAGLMILVAIAIVAMGLFGGTPEARRRLGLIAGVVGLLGALGFLVSQQRTIGGSVGTYLGSASARTSILLVVVAGVAAIFAAIGARTSLWWAPWAAGAAAAVALAVRAHGGHAAAVANPRLAETIQWIHTLAGACWAGGLLLLVLLLRERRDDPPTREARRFSAMALVAIGVVVTSGLIRSAAELGGWSGIADALHTSYGQTLAIKVSIVLVVIALGAYNRMRGLRRLEEDARPLRRVVEVELVAIAGILLLTATLTSLAPPVGAAPASAAPANAVTLTGSDFATTIDLALTVTPAQPGPNLYRATVTAYGTDQPVTADAVTLHLRSVTRPELPAATVDLRPDAAGWVAQGLDPSVEGTFRVLAEIRTGADVATVPLTLITRSSGIITTNTMPGGDTVAVASFDDGVRLEGSSSVASPTQVHLTAFAANGTELALRDLTVVATPMGGEPERLPAERFTPGHFAVTSPLAPGTWTLDAVASTRDGRTYQCTWQTSVAG